MSRRPNLLLAAVLGVIALTLGAAACSGDGDSSDAGTPDPTEQAAGTDDDGQDGPGDATGGSADGDDSRPFGVDRSQLATALETATSADDHEVDGNTIRLIFNDGSKDDVTATINCSASAQIKSDDDEVELVYPDGTVDCTTLLADR